MASSAQWLTFTKPFCGIALSISIGFRGAFDKEDQKAEKRISQNEGMVLYI